MAYKMADCEKQPSVRERMARVLTRIHDEFEEEDLMRLRLWFTDKFPANDLHILETQELIFELCKRVGYAEAILLLKQKVPELICDITDVHIELEELSRFYTEELRGFDLLPGHGNKIFGRTHELKVLHDLLSKYAGKKVINVYGPPGIGKTNLVRHLGVRINSDGDLKVLYVNIRDHSTLADAFVTILRKLGVEQTSTEENLKSLLVEKLSVCDKGLILILDDLASLMATSEKVHSVLEFLSHLICHMSSKERTFKFKIVLASRNEIRREVAATDRIKLSITDDVEDIALAPLTDEDARKFFEESIQTLPQLDKLIKLCHGHPFCLNLVREHIALCNSGPAGSLAALTASDVESCVNKTLDLIEPLFNSLVDHQRDFLLAVSLFKGGATIEALYYVIEPKGQSIEEFDEQIRREFSNGFWITISAAADPQQESFKKRVIETHHPLIDKYLAQLCTNERFMYSLERLRSRFQVYFMRMVAEIGREYLEEPKRGMEIMARSTRNIERAFEMGCQKIQNFDMENLFGNLDENENPCGNLENKENTFGNLEKNKIIMYMFICFHHQPELFSGRFKALIDKIVHGPDLSDKRYFVITCLLRNLLFAVEKDWRKLNNILKDRLDFQLLSSHPKLHQFCEAIDYHVRSLFDTHSPGSIDKVDKVHFDRRELLFKRSEKLFKGLKTDSSFDKIADYFLVYVYVNKAEAIFNTDVKERETIEKATKTCAKASESADNSIILVPFFKGMYASYKSYLGDKEHDKDAIKLLNESIRHFEESLAGYEAFDMHTFYEAAELRHSYAVAIRSKAIKLDKKDNKDRLDLLKSSIPVFEKAAFDLSNYKNKMMLFKNYLIMAQCYENLQAYTPKEASEETYLYKRKALEYYKKTYDLLEKDPENCNITHDYWVLLELMTRLPFLLEKCGEPFHDVKAKLIDIQKKCKKDVEGTYGDLNGNHYSSDDLGDPLHGNHSVSSRKRNYHELSAGLPSDITNQWIPPKRTNHLAYL